MAVEQGIIIMPIETAISDLEGFYTRFSALIQEVDMILPANLISISSRHEETNYLIMLNPDHIKKSEISSPQVAVINLTEALMVDDTKTTLISLIRKSLGIIFPLEPEIDLSPIKRHRMDNLVSAVKAHNYLLERCLSGDSVDLAALISRLNTYLQVYHNYWQEKEQTVRDTDQIGPQSLEQIQRSLEYKFFGLTFLDFDYNDLQPSIAKMDKNLALHGLAELIRNAYKYKAGLIQVNFRKNNGYYVIEVSDNGSGIPSSEIGRIFEDGFRSASIDPNEIQGTGRGLFFLANMVLGERGGSIEVYSKDPVSKSVAGVEISKGDKDGFRIQQMEQVNDLGKFNTKFILNISEDRLCLIRSRNG